MNVTQGTKKDVVGIINVGEESTSNDGRDKSGPYHVLLRRMLWMCLLLACCGTSWFAYQYMLVPHSTSFVPDWQGAQWVQASDGTTPVAYFRYTTSMNALPDGAFVTVAASQIFRLYVNETFIGSNTLDFAQGNFPRAYMYDIVSSLRLGKNVLSVRVTNVDGKPPALRLSFGVAQGHVLSFQGTGNQRDSWQGTSESNKAQLRYSDTLRDWTKSDFDASTWPPVSSATSTSAEPMLGVNPLIYEQPVPTQWMSAGNGHEAYFVRQLTLPLWTNGTWLRLAATGTARIFINGHLFMIWNGQAPVPQQSLASYLSSDSNIVRYRAGLVLGVYDISSYIHPGVNTIAVHVSAPGIITTRAGLGNLNAAMAFDLLSTDMLQHTVWLASNNEWHASYLPVSNWAEGGTALAWSVPLTVGRPGVAQSFYLSDTSNPRSQQYIPLSLSFAVIAGSGIGVVLVWLLMALFVLRPSVRSQQEALELSSLAFLPALACEAVLVVLAREPQMPHPFPYTWPWVVLLLGIITASYILLRQNARRISLARIDAELFTIPVREEMLRGRTDVSSGERAPARGRPYKDTYVSKVARVFVGASPCGRPVMGLLRTHWPLLCILLLATPLICYNLPYEPYWQDELTSYYAAKGILAHGLPIMPSGFLYAKGELYSYMLALCMAIFGDQHGVPRVVSVVEYLVSLPVLYMIGTYFFGRRVALLATAMLALSPTALVWGRQVRMYEQAQLLTMLLVYLFYRALRERERVSLVYLAFGTMLLTYLSHEETFILFPAIALSIVVMKGNEYLQWRFGPVVGAYHCRGVPLAGALKLKPKPEWRILRHWLLAAILGAAGVGIQLLIAHYSHPPILGTDQSQRPLIQLTTDNIPYYLYLLFYPAVLGHGEMPFITINSLLATAGCIVALRSRYSRAKYCAMFLLLSLITLTLTFTLATDRYIYPILPLYYLMGAFAMLKGLQGVWNFARRSLASQYALIGGYTIPEGYLARTPYLVSRLTLGLLCSCVLLTPILPISGYNLFVSQSAGFAYHKHYPDYDGVGQYMQQHWRKGDVVVAVSPAISVLYYVGRVDYFFSINRALYLFERNGHIIDTPTGSVALLNQDDFQAVVAAHARVWIISDNGLYQQEAMKDNRFVFPPDFHIVYEGYGSAIYFQGS